MKWMCFLLIGFVFASCGNNNPKQQNEKDETGLSYNTFAARFKKAELTYELTDSGLLKDEDTAALHNEVFASYIPDSVLVKALGKAGKTTFVPLVRAEGKGEETFFIVKALGNKRKAALIVTFKSDGTFGAAFPFLVPDNNPKTSQKSSLDKSLSITRAVSNKAEDGLTTEGKEVYAYNKTAKSFILVMTDLLDDSSVELINPIDTFSKIHAFAGDYGSDKKNIVSVRDGRNKNEINFYIYFEKDGGACSGELKGTAFFTTGSTAVYRQSGDACVLELQFSSSAVTLEEDEGCGLHRGLKCSFNGTYKKNKALKKETLKKGGKK